MDGAQWIEMDDDMPISIPVSLSRDRFSRPDTYTRASFTAEQLDAVAPLSESNLLSLRLNNPSEHTKKQMRRRIAAACNLKYRMEQWPVKDENA